MDTWKEKLVDELGIATSSDILQNQGCM